MRLIPVALALFYRKVPGNILEVWTQVREDDGAYHGLLEFPGGGIEENETPLMAAVREVQEEVGIEVRAADATSMGIYQIQLDKKVILLNVFLFPDYEALKGKGKWLVIDGEKLSSPYEGLIPPPNHQIIDELYQSLYTHSK